MDPNDSKQSHSDIVTEPTQTEHQVVEPLDFATLTDVLDHAVELQALSGLNFYSGRGELSEAVTHPELAAQGRVAGAKLLTLGLKKGDRVGLVAETEANFTRAFMGCLYAGLLPCPLPLPVAFGAPGAYAQTLRRVLDVADAKAVIVPDEYKSLLEDQLADYDFLFVGSLDELGPASVELPKEKPAADDIAYLQFSSGTTSAPKGIAITHRAVLANIHGMAVDALKFDSSDRGVSWLPFYHDMGLVGCMLLPIATHMTMDYLPTRDFIRRPALWVSMISRAKATTTYAPTFGYELAAKRLPKDKDLDLSSWRIAGLGGDMIKPDSLASFTEAYEPFGFRRTNFVPSYGMAEVSLGATFEVIDKGYSVNRLDLAALERDEVLLTGSENANSREFVLCGPALPNHEVEIRNENGAVLGERHIGTVFFKGPSLMRDYFRDAAETRQMLSDDGWLNTGDLGYLTDGNLVLTGRAKDLIIINGRNIWPQDIEWSVEKAIPSIREGRVAAFDGSEAASTGEESVAVVIEFRSQKEEDRNAVKSEIDALLRASFGVSPIVALSGPGGLPRTSSGKLARGKARSLFLEGAFDV